MPLLLLILFPLLELWLLIEAGDAIGGWAVIGLVVLTGLLGIGLLRLQGRMILGRLRAALALGEAPEVGARELFNGLCVALAGLLLIFPGFVSDGLALLLLVPALRGGAGRRLWNWLRRSERVRVYVARPEPPAPPPEPPRVTVIEGDYREVPPPDERRSS
jgi:UPF0716 protein FxsA